MPENKRHWADDLLKEVLEEDKARKEYVPKPGDTIYIPTALYADFQGDILINGGQAEVLRVNEVLLPEDKNYTTVVRVKGLDYYPFSWNFIAEKQGDLKEKFGNQKASSIKI